MAEKKGLAGQLLLDALAVDLREYAVQGNAVLGIRDSGKSYRATYIAERLMDAWVPIVAFDPAGIWHWLRVAGTGSGYPVVVASGNKPDLPLTPYGAPEIVRAAMREGVSIVLDLYSMRLSTPTGTASSSARSACCSTKTRATACAISSSSPPPCPPEAAELISPAAGGPDFGIARQLYLRGRNDIPNLLRRRLFVTDLRTASRRANGILHEPASCARQGPRIVGARRLP
jgi:hypothetical protein